MKLKIILFSFLFLFSSFDYQDRIEPANPILNEDSCQKGHRYKVMESRKADLSKSELIHRKEVLIIVENTLPPIKWWQPFTAEKPGVLGKDKISNETYYYTRHHIFRDQILVRIVNNTSGNKLIEFPDRHLMIGLEALDKNGKWVEVEEHFRGICGNSFKPHRHKELNPGGEMLTYTQLFKGSMKTSYRLKLRTSRADSVEIYSNEIEGTIDECKFIYKRF